MADTEEQQVETTEPEPTKEAVADEQPVEEAAEESDDEEIEYVCPAEFDEREEMKKMFVGGLDKDTTDEEFKGLFSTFGEVTDFIIIRKENSKSDRLFGFITFSKCDELEDCLLARPHKYKEKELDVKRAVPRGQDDGNGHCKVKKLHVANVPNVFDSKILKKYLKSRHPIKYGTIEEINFLKEKEDEKKNRGFGFITVSSEDFADRIAIGEAKFTLEGNSMRISKAKPRSSEGGGFRNKQNFGGQGRQQGGWEDWNQYGGGGYGAYGGYGGGYGGYAGGYGGYGGGYGDYYGGGYGNYGPQRSGRGGRFNPY